MKIRYRDRIAALLTLAVVRRQDNSWWPKLERRAYRCPDCHLLTLSDANGTARVFDASTQTLAS